MTHTAQKAIFVGMIVGALLQGSLCLGQDADGGSERDITQPPREAIMTGADPGTARISPKPRSATIAQLGALTRPAALPPRGAAPPAYRAVRLGPGETTLWSVDARIIESQLNDDGDFHLVLRDAAGRRMACELPDPKRMPHPSPFARQMTRARAALAARLHTTTAPRPCDVPARVTGLGYYGHVRPGDGLTPNGLQLHPVVGVAFPK